MMFYLYSLEDAVMRRRDPMTLAQYDFIAPMILTLTDTVVFVYEGHRINLTNMIRIS